MPVLEWDTPGNRTFETGVDRAVLYHEDGSATPWNGVTAVTARPTSVVTPVFYDGVKVGDSITTSSFTGALRAITYPDEFLYYEGEQDLVSGVTLGEQRPKPFNFSYRTKIGSDLDGDATKHKIHVLYNVIAVPSDKVYASMSITPTITEFEWTLTTSQYKTTRNGPTAHFIFDERKTNATLWGILEYRLYGGSPSDAYANLPTFEEMLEIVEGYYTFEVIDNKDGTWTAKTNVEGYIYMTDEAETEFRIANANAEYLSADEYSITDIR
jgi:hypothetical protein